MIRTLSMQRKVSATFIVVAFLVILALSLAYRTTLQLQSSNVRIQSHEKAYVALADLLTGLIEMEGGLRGFFLSGKDSSLVLYSEADAGIAARLAQMKSSFDAAPDLKAKATNLERLVTEEVTSCRQILKTAKAEGTESARHLIREDDARSRLDAIRKNVAEMKAEVGGKVRHQQEKIGLADARLRKALLGIAGLVVAFLVASYVFIHRNLELRQQTELALRENAEILSITLNSIGDGVLSTDGEGRVVRMNPVAEKMTGWSLSEAKGRLVAEVFNIVNEETRRPARVSVDTVLLTGETRGLANHSVLLARDRHEYAVADSAAPIRDRDGRMVGVILVFRDVTEQRRLHREIEKLARIAAATDNAVVLTDAQRRIEWVNEAFTRITGYTLDEVRGNSPSMLQGAETNAETVASIRGRLAAGEGFSGELLNYAKDGRQYWVSVEIQPFRDKAGNVTGFMSIQSDITQRKQLEEDLRRFNLQLTRRMESSATELKWVEERFHVLAEHSDDVFWFLMDDQSLYASPAFERIWGRSAAMLRGDFEVWSGAIHPEDRERVLVQRNELIAGKRPVYDATYRVVRTDGSIRWVRDTGKVLLDPNGGVRLTAGLARDVTERMETQKKELRTQRLESIGTLAGGLAHDLNNTLTPIIMSAEMLRMELFGAGGEAQSGTLPVPATRLPAELAATIRTCLEAIESSARRAADMVRQVLIFAKGTQGDRIPVQVRHALAEIEKIIRATFTKSIQTQASYQKEDAWVMADPIQLHQVLLNLCVNARDAMPKGGTLSIEAVSIEVDDTYASFVAEAKPGRYVRISVTDTGAGIPPEIMDRIFEPFFTTKGPSQGTGLGLSTVLGVVRSHDGFLRVYSEVGRGTTFEVYLPQSEQSLSVAEPPPVPSQFRGRGELVLVVDDEPFVRDTVKATLEKLNFKVLLATDGSTAMLLIAERREDIHLVLTDVDMPGMDGIAFLRVVLRMTPNVKVMVMTGLADNLRKSDLEEVGVSMVLRKPFRLGEFIEAIQRVYS
jgi:PAS domain S-box-containing protein